jgi:hypothetical protein
MRSPARLLRVATAALCLCGAVNGYAQNAKLTRMAPGHVRKELVDVHKVQKFSPYAVLSVRMGGPVAGTSERLLNGPVMSAVTTGGGGGTIAGLDTIPTFSGAFAAQNGPTADDFFPLGNVFPFIMVGNEPLVGGTTTIPTNHRSFAGFAQSRWQGGPFLPSGSRAVLSRGERLQPRRIRKCTKANLGLRSSWSFLSFAVFEFRTKLCLLFQLQLRLVFFHERLDVIRGA